MKPELIIAHYIITAGKHQDIVALQKNTKISVFHGTTMDFAVKFCSKGIDATRKTHRLYPHHDRGKKVERGMFVTPDYKTASHYGRFVIKFTTLGKNLFPMFPYHANDKDTQKWMEEKYPKSFRPQVSYDMLERGESENQALFIGKLSPRAITKIYSVSYGNDGSFKNGSYGKYRGSWDRQGFLDWYEEMDFGSQHRKEDTELALVEPQEKITLKELLNRIMKQGYEKKPTIDAFRAIAKEPDFNLMVHDVMMNFDMERAPAKHIAKQLKKQFGGKK